MKKMKRSHTDTFAPLKHHYFKYETEDIEEEILEKEVNDIPGFL